jgi:hypothetical protein
MELVISPVITFGGKYPVSKVLRAQAPLLKSPFIRDVHSSSPNHQRIMGSKTLTPMLGDHFTVTLLARFLGLSISAPLSSAM